MPPLPLPPIAGLVGALALDEVGLAAIPPPLDFDVAPEPPYEDFFAAPMPIRIS
jgi:hypothetical protein